EAAHGIFRSDGIWTLADTASGGEGGGAQGRLERQVIDRLVRRAGRNFCLGDLGAVPRMRLLAKLNVDLVQPDLVGVILARAERVSLAQRQADCVLVLSGMLGDYPADDRRGGVAPVRIRIGHQHSSSAYRSSQERALCSECRMASRSPRT